jgi:hypothetical protein
LAQGTIFFSLEGELMIIECCIEHNQLIEDAARHEAQAPLLWLFLCH